MEEKRSELRSWQVGLAGLLGGAVVVAAILALWRPWIKLPPIGEVRGEILESDIKEIQKLTAQLAKDPIQSMELLETGAIDVTIERTLEFFIFELVGDKWTMTSSGYYATSMGSPPPLPAMSIDMSGPRDAPWPATAPAAATAPPNTFPAVDRPKMVDSIQYYKAGPTIAVAPADTPGARRLTPLEEARARKAIADSEIPAPAAPYEGLPSIPRVPAPGERKTASPIAR